MSTDAEQHRPEPGPELVPVAVAARHFGISERAVRKRITVGTLRGLMVDRAWHVYLSNPEPEVEPEQFRGSVGSRNRNSSGTGPPMAIASQQPAAAIMQEWIAPLAARIEALAHENGTLEADLRIERERREAAERERDELRTCLAAQYDASPPQPSNVSPEGAQPPSEASEKPRPSWWRRFFLGEG